MRHALNLIFWLGMGLLVVLITSASFELQPQSSEVYRPPPEPPHYPPIIIHRP